MRRGFEALRHTLINDPMQLVMPLIILAVTFLVAWVVRRLVLRALTAWNARTQSRAGTISYEALRGPSFLWTVILAVQVALQSSNLPARYTARGSDALLVLWIFSLTLMSMRLAGSMVRFYGGQIPGAMPVTTLTQNLAQIVVLILGAETMFRLRCGRRTRRAFILHYRRRRSTGCRICLKSGSATRRDTPVGQINAGKWSARPEADRTMARVRSTTRSRGSAGRPLYRSRAANDVSSTARHARRSPPSLPQPSATSNKDCQFPGNG